MFLLRLKEWQREQANAGKQARVLVPVVWVPAKPPRVLEPFQYSDDAWPALYLKEGLLALAMRKGRSDAYNAVLNELARRIAETLKSVTLPDGPLIQHFGLISSAFHLETTPTKYGIALIILADVVRAAKPFAASEASLDALIEQVGGACSAPVRSITISNNLAADVAAAIAAREMPVLLAHQASVDSAANGPLIQALASAFNEASTVLVFSDPVPDAQKAAVALKASADASLGNVKGKVGAAGCLIATDAASLAVELEKRLSKVRTELIAQDPPARVESAELVQSAAIQGIALMTQPVLGGPGG